MKKIKILNFRGSGPGGTQLVYDIMRINCFSGISRQTPPPQQLVRSQTSLFDKKSGIHHPQTAARGVGHPDKTSLLVGHGYLGFKTRTCCLTDIQLSYHIYHDEDVFILQLPKNATFGTFQSIAHCEDILCVLVTVIFTKNFQNL